MLLTLEDTVLNHSMEGEILQILEKILVERCGFSVKIHTAYVEKETGRFQEEEEAKIRLKVDAIYSRTKGRREEGEQTASAEGSGQSTAQDPETGKDILAIPESEVTGTIKTMNDLMGFFGVNTYTTLQLKNTYAHDTLTLYGVGEADVRRLGLPYAPAEQGWRVTVPDPAAAAELIRREPALFRDFELTKGRMDDVFLAVTGKKLAGGAEK